MLYRRLLGYVKGMGWYFALAIFGYILAAQAEILLAQTLGNLVDTFEPSQSGQAATPGNVSWMPNLAQFIAWEPILKFPFLIVAIALFRAVGAVVGEFLLSRVSFHVVHSVRCDLYDRLLVLPSSYFDRNKQGNLSNLLTDSASNLRDTTTDVLKIAIQDGVKLILIFLALIALNFLLTVVWLVFAPLVWLIVHYASKRFRHISRNIQDSMGDVTHVGQETVNAYKTIRAFGAVEQEKTRFHDASDSNRKQHLKMIATKASSTQFIQLLIAVALGLLVAVLFIPEIAGQMSSGDLVQYILLTGLLANPIKRLSDLNSRLQRGLASAEKIFQQIDQEAEHDTGTYEVDRIEGKIEFKNVSFYYEERGAEVLHDFSLEILPGQTVAIVGSSGSGKTTVTELLMGFYEAQEGQILLDGKPIEEFTKRNLRHHIGVVSQDIFLFNSSLRENIAFGELENASGVELADALRRARVNEFLDSLDNGLDTLVGDRGSMLSQGQRQRIAIARALLKDAPVLILDEATSALDAESEGHLQAALSEVMHRRTTLTVAHQLSTVERADKIIVLEHGRIVESGTHQELLSNGGRYQDLYQHQHTGDVPVIPRSLPTEVKVYEPHDLNSKLVKAWYSNSSWLWVFRPLSWLFGLIVRKRYANFRAGKAGSWKAPVPVVVVGNITVGGTGKTPLTIWLAEWFREKGMNVGIVSRGYPGKGPFPQRVTEDSSISQVGDEAPFLAQRTGCPVVVDKNRENAIRTLTRDFEVDLVLSDDGLQHYQMARDIEIAVIDGARALGNEQLLPAGPLREPRTRLDTLDWVVANGQATGLVHDESIMHTTAQAFVNIYTQEELTISQWRSRFPDPVQAYAGLGNPVRFQRTLQELGITATMHMFADHVVYHGRDFNLRAEDIVVITEKDWRKVRGLALPCTEVWYLKIGISFDPPVERKLRELFKHHGLLAA